MKFLIDVNASGSLAQWLREKAHDVAMVIDVDPTMTDELILAWANREQRIIITTDKDFEQMIWIQRKSHWGVLRLQNLPRAARKVLLEEVLANYSQDLLSGAIVIASQQKIRIRRPLD